MKGIRRVKGAAQDAKAALVTEDIREMVETLPDNLKGARDRALLLLGFAGAFRRSELVGLDVADLEFVKEGVRVTIRRSKTDQEGEGRVVGIPFGSRIETCPVRSLEAWGEASQIETGPVFRSINRHGQIQPGRLSGAAVAQVVKSAAGAAGLDPTKYAGHSLRAGLATAAAAAGVAASAIQAQTGHKSLAMLLPLYQARERVPRQRGGSNRPVSNNRSRTVAPRFATRTRPVSSLTWESDGAQTEITEAAIRCPASAVHVLNKLAKFLWLRFDFDSRSRHLDAAFDAHGRRFAHIRNFAAASIVRTPYE